MEFYRPQRKQSQVPIVPMIDILFILLIFFIVATTFKKPRPVLQIELPTVREVPTVTETESRSTLSISAEGVVSLDSLRIPNGLLEAYLKAFLKENPGRKLELEADRRLPLEELLGVWDSLTKAGILIKDVPARIKLPEEGGDHDSSDCSVWRPGAAPEM